MKAYFISGLGADSRVFRKIKLPGAYSIKHIEWIIPKENESLPSYSLRLTEQMDLGEPFILVGLSFGGIVVTELTKLINPVKSIVLSSITTREQLPWYFKVISMLKLHSLVPTQEFKRPNKLTFWVFGAETVEEKEKLSQILHDTNPEYLKWAVHAFLTWKNTIKPNNLLHIHGTNDHILPIRYAKPDISIEGGRHFMVATMAEQINEILEKELSRV